MTLRHWYAAAFAHWLGRTKAKCALVLGAAMCFASGEAFSQAQPEDTFTDAFSFSPAYINMFGSSAFQVTTSIFDNPNYTFTVTDTGETGTLYVTQIGNVRYYFYLKTIITFGPDTVTTGQGIICTQAPTRLPSPFCTGGTPYIVGDDETNFNTNLYSDLSLDPAAASLLTGDLHTTFQTVLQEDGWRFVDGIFARLRGFGPGDDPGSTAVLGIGTQLAAADLGRGIQLAATDPDGRVRVTPFTVWFKPYGTFGKLDSSSERVGFSYTTAGFNAGLDYKFLGNWLIGGAVGYGHSWISQDVTVDTGRIDSVQLAVYGGYRDRQLHVLAGFMYAHHWIDGERFTPLAPMTTKSSYTADQFGVGVEAGYKIDTGWGWLQPFGSLVFTRLHLHSFSETGTTFLELAGKSENVNALKLSFGVRAWFDYEVAGFVLTPELRARYVHDVLNERRSLTASFVNDPSQATFAVRGVKPSPAAAILGAGVSARIMPRLKASLNYDAEMHSNLTAHTVQASIKFSW